MMTKAAPIAGQTIFLTSGRWSLLDWRCRTWEQRGIEPRTGGVAAAKALRLSLTYVGRSVVPNEWSGAGRPAKP